MKVLVIDVGGSKVKMLATGHREPRTFLSGTTLTPRQFVSQVKKCAKDWKYDVVSIGYPGKVLQGRPFAEPRNLGRGWVGFDYAAAFGCPVRIMNDAAMQALGSYGRGTMLFLGLGTGLGSALVVKGAVEPMELSMLPYKRATYEDYLGARGLARLGKKKWRNLVTEVVDDIVGLLDLDEVVIGGGNVKKLKTLPARCRVGSNSYAFHGGFLMWKKRRS
jgi:polyphosphate glucokinase